MGVLVPLGMGTLLGFLFAPGESDPSLILQHVFIGTILTATSVSLTVETLKEIGKLNTKVGNNILAAALIDDVLGLIVLTIVTSLAGDTVNVGLVLVKILLFFVFVAAMAFVGVKLFTWYENRFQKNLHRFPLLAFVLCLVMAFVAEEVFGVADIIGAFAAGVIVANTPRGAYIESKFQPLSYLLLAPVFFASIGSVSYTHLDVYKRQVHCQVRQPLHCLHGEGHRHQPYWHCSDRSVCQRWPGHFHHQRQKGHHQCALQLRAGWR